VLPERQSLTIKHQDIGDYMMAMTMTFRVSRPDLMRGREPGELVSGTLEVDSVDGHIVELAHVGSAPLPSQSNEVALSQGQLREGDRVPDASFLDEDGRARDVTGWRNTVTALTFTYTRCPLPNFCPLMDRNFTEVARLVSRDPAVAGKVRLVTITFDPDHDTPAVLKAHAARVKADPAIWTFLTGNRAAIESFAARFGVSIVRDGGSGGSITHTLSTAVIGGDGRVRKIYAGNEWTPAELFADIRVTLGLR
jgi:protein SCO1/2